MNRNPTDQDRFTTLQAAALTGLLSNPEFFKDGSRYSQVGGVSKAATEAASIAFHGVDKEPEFDSTGHYVAPRK